MAISPWSDSVEVASPNRRYKAQVTGAMEIAMGAPTSGTLSVSCGIKRKQCNPSIVWSSDSRFLAVPQWTKNRAQRLLIIEVEKGKSYWAPKVYRVLELHNFVNGTIYGVDSPEYNPVQVEVKISEIIPGA